MHSARPPTPTGSDLAAARCRRLTGREQEAEDGACATPSEPGRAAAASWQGRVDRGAATIFGGMHTSHGADAGGLRPGGSEASRLRRDSMSGYLGRPPQRGDRRLGKPGRTGRPPSGGPPAAADFIGKDYYAPALAIASSGGGFGPSGLPRWCSSVGQPACGGPISSLVRTVEDSKTGEKFCCDVQQQCVETGECWDIFGNVSWCSINTVTGTCVAGECGNASGPAGQMTITTQDDCPF